MVVSKDACRYRPDRPPSTSAGGTVARAFTLLELVIVIAIIALLTAILMPALRGARAESRRAVCLSNLHHIGLATDHYLNDYNDRFWRYFQRERGGMRWWFGFEPGGPGSGTDRPLDTSRAVLAPYLRNADDRMQCPVFPYNASCFFRKFAARSASYGFNVLLGPPNPRATTARRDQLGQAPSSVFVFADGAHFDHNPGMNEGHYVEYKRNPRRRSGYGHFRHRGQAMVLYIDGHAEGQPLRGPAHSRVCGGPAGNLTDPAGGASIYGPNVRP